MEVKHSSWSPASRLPDEIIVRLLHLCSYQTILRFAKTCRRYRDLVVNTASLQLHIELDVSGLQVASGHGTLSANRGHLAMLNDIRAYRKAWESLDFEPDFQKVQHRVRGAGSWSTYHNLLFKRAWPNTMATAGLVILTPLDTADCSISIETEAYSAIAIDPTQELIVLVRLNLDHSSSSFGTYVDLVSSVTGGPHPNANPSNFRVERLIPPEINSTDGAQDPLIALMGEMLLISFSNNRIPRYTIFAWNWKTGELCQALSDNGYLCDISQLDQHHFSALVGIGNPNARVRELCLRVYMVHSTPMTYDRPPGRNAPSPSVVPNRPVLQLNFPTPRKSYSTHRLDTSFLAQPDYPGRPIQLGSTTFSYPRIPTLGIRLGLQEANFGTYQRLQIFACVDNLLQLGTNQSRALSWSEWGVTCTRWFVDEPIQNVPLNRYLQEGMSASRYVRILCDAERREDGEDKEGREDGGGDETQVDRRDGILEDRLFCVADFKHAYSRTDLDEGLTREDQDLIRGGHWLFSAQNHNVPADTMPKAVPSSLNNLPQHSEEIRTVVVGSNTPTILGEKDGFNEPVESRLPYRLVARRRPVPRGACWPLAIDHDRIIGLQVNVELPDVIAIIYRLRPLNHD